MAPGERNPHTHTHAAATSRGPFDSTASGNQEQLSPRWAWVKDSTDARSSTRLLATREPGPRHARPNRLGWKAHGGSVEHTANRSEHHRSSTQPRTSQEHSRCARATGDTLYPGRRPPRFPQRGRDDAVRPRTRGPTEGRRVTNSGRPSISPHPGDRPNGRVRNPPHSASTHGGAQDQFAPLRGQPGRSLSTDLEVRMIPSRARVRREAGTNRDRGRREARTNCGWGHREQVPQPRGFHPSSP